MSDPANRTADREEHQRRAGGQLEHAGDGGEREVDVRVFADRCPRGGGEVARVRQVAGPRIALRQEREEQRRTGVAARVERMAEALEAIAAPDAGGDLSPEIC